MILRTAWNLLRTTVVEWFDDDPFHLAAALAYYTLFSLGPLLLILVSLAGFILGDQAVRGEILTRTQAFAGKDAAGAIREALHNARFDPAGPFAAAASVVVLVLGSTAVFSELQVTLNRIWDVRNPSTGAVLQMLRQRLWAIVMILVLSFLLLVSLVLETAVAAVASHWLEIPPFVIQWSNLAVAFAVTIGLFAIIYRVFPEAEVRWRDALFGATVTAVLFAAGRILLGLYLGWSGLGSTYGAAGSLIVLLAWLYYSSLILFLGAEFTFVFGRPDLWRETGGSDRSSPEREALDPGRGGSATAGGREV
jgi:membrane protein